mmetsp:Transcript_24924/g.22113  ORF Transcript_24924/g.22113 Transcript_24924/m.22113 type:complete len:98 (+) Transcript_24924:398-691(+)
MSNNLNPRVSPHIQKIDNKIDNPREISKRLFNRRDDIFLPHISKTKVHRRDRAVNYVNHISPSPNKKLMYLKNQSILDKYNGRNSTLERPISLNQKL